MKLKLHWLRVCINGDWQHGGCWISREEALYRQQYYEYLLGLSAYLACHDEEPMDNGILYSKKD